METKYLNQIKDSINTVRDYLDGKTKITLTQLHHSNLKNS